jgi:hypothetical protein
LGDLRCTWCYCGRDRYWGNFDEHGVIVGGSIIGRILVHMVLLWEEAILGELRKTCYFGREQCCWNCCEHGVTVGGSNMRELL